MLMVHFDGFQTELTVVVLQVFYHHHQLDGVGGDIPGIPSPPPSLSFRFKA